ncbi:MAG: tetratricopeptide repeat protein [Planctomycetes bacterium]|nr:tetratricopeptide repeat protein [Planctomycetota bacterium]
MARLFIRLLVFALLAFAASAQSSGRASFDAGVAAYRAGDFARARSHWLATLDDPTADVDRAALCFDLGNATARAGDFPQAVGWFSAARRLAPRDGKVRANLEFARREGGFEPFDKGDLASTVQRVVDVWTVAEASWFALAVLGAFVAALLLEAFRGGALWKRLAFLFGVFALLALVPWVKALERERADGLLVIEKSGAALKSEPRGEATTIETLPAGATVRRRDGLPGWVQVGGVLNASGWVREESVFALAR